MDSVLSVADDFRYAALLSDFLGSNFSSVRDLLSAGRLAQKISEAAAEADGEESLIISADGVFFCAHG